MILFCFIITTLFAQGKVRYGIVETTLWNGKKISPKQQVIDALKENNKSKMNKTGDIWTNVFNSNYLRERDENRKIPISIDSSFVLCKIIQITKKNDNYVLKKNRLIRKPVFLIDFICYNADSLIISSNMRIISFSNDTAKIQGAKIIKDHVYKLFLISHFATDCCKTLVDNKIVEIVKGPATMHCVILNHIWIVNLDLNYNWYKTPNLDGLYYIPPEKAKHK
ncbi:MAG: hypothetical protein PHY85_01310 [Bacteroidales bacterium]|nr:hypothetical protein [Bacteroidales bacterium]